MRIFANDLRIPEAPVLLPDGSWLFTEMGAERGCTTHINSDGKSRRIVAKTGRPSGLTLDRDGFIWVAETVMRALLKMSLDGRYIIPLNKFVFFANFCIVNQSYQCLGVRIQNSGFRIGIPCK